MKNRLLLVALSNYKGNDRSVKSALNIQPEDSCTDVVVKQRNKGTQT